MWEDLGVWRQQPARAGRVMGQEKVRFQRTFHSLRPHSFCVPAVGIVTIRSPHQPTFFCVLCLPHPTPPFARHLGFRVGVLAGHGGHSSRSSGTSAWWDHDVTTVSVGLCVCTGEAGTHPGGRGARATGGRASCWARESADQSCARVWGGPLLLSPKHLGLACGRGSDPGT